MVKMVGFLLSSFMKGSIWKEALKSLLYFFILFVVLLIPSFKFANYFAGSQIERQYGVIASDVGLGVISLLFSLVFAYLVVMFARDSYFYKLVKAELGGEDSEQSGVISQLKSFIRVVFLLVATFVGVLISLFMPLLGMVLLSFCFALEILSYVFDTEKVSLIGSFKFVFGNILAVFALGGFCFFLSLIPGLGLVSYPSSVRAAALYFKDQKELQ